MSGKGFPLETMKNLCILNTTFERGLETMHPPHRIENIHTNSAGVIFEGISPWDIRPLIKSIQTVSDLMRIVREGAKPNPEDTMEPWVLPKDAVFLQGQQVKRVANSKENRQRHGKVAREYALEISIHDPCENERECDSEIGGGGSEERFSDSWDGWSRNNP